MGLKMNILTGVIAYYIFKIVAENYMGFKPIPLAFALGWILGTVIKERH